jgi:hypothetical protein
MIVGGFSYAGTLARPGGAGASQPSGGAAVQAPIEEKAQDGTELSGRAPFFSAISSISHGSLVTAYQAMRSQATASAAPVASGAAPAIESGVGIPAAMSAYSEVIDHGQGA